jgi:hypothetical protein
MPWEKPFANEHAARLRDPGDFLRIRQLWAHDGIRGIGGPLKTDPRGGTVEQAIRFKAAKWTVAEAKRWLAEHDYKPILFEVATGGEDSVGGSSSMPDVLTAGIAAEPKELDNAEHALTVTITTDTADRHGDILLPSGVKLERYRANPVVLHCHDHEALPIARSMWERVLPREIVARPQFHLQTELSREVWGLVRKGLLNAWSVGFLPEEWEPLEPKGFRITVCDLLEYSSVVVPANFDALTHALKAARISAPALVKSLGDLGLVAPDLVSQTVKTAPETGPAAEEEDTMPEKLKELTVEQLEAERPDIVGKLKAAGQEEEAEKAKGEVAKAKEKAVSDAREALLAEGATLERARVKTIREKAVELELAVDDEAVLKAFDEGAAPEAAEKALMERKIVVLKAAAPKSQGADGDPEAEAKARGQDKASSPGSLTPSEAWEKNVELPDGKKVQEQFPGGGKSSFLAWAERDVEADGLFKPEPKETKKD